MRLVVPKTFIDKMTILNEIGGNEPLSSMTSIELVVVPDEGENQGDEEKKEFFENLVTGNCNILAQKAANSFCKETLKDNTLLIYGDFGTGKTSLIQAMQVKIAKKSPEKKVLSVTGRTLIDDCIFSLRHRKIKEFKEKILGYDVILLDDFQDLLGKNAVLEELRPVISEFLKQGKHLAIVSIISIDELYGTESDFLYVLNDVLEVKLRFPEKKVKIAVLEQYADNLGFEWSDNDKKAVLDFIADRSIDFWKLIDNLRRVISFAHLLNEKLDVYFAKRILNER